jgi:hypothetical protein
MISPFFYHAFNRLPASSVEPATNTIELPEVDASVFGLLVNWLYTGKIEFADRRPLELLEAAKLWTVAGTCRLSTLQNKALVLVVSALSAADDKLIKSPTDEQVRDFCYHVYETRDDTELKELTAEHMTGFVTSDTVDMWLRVFPQGMRDDFTRALVRALAKVPGHEIKRKPTVEYFVPEFDIKKELDL